MNKEIALAHLRDKMPGLDKNIREAIETLIPELQESEDERIRMALICGLSEGLSEHNWQGFGGATIDECLAYLEKQKDLDKMIVVSPEVWDNAISDAFENGKKEGKKQKEPKPEEKSINWTELTWKDIVELEGIINNVHYDFSAGIGQESFGKEVLERFRSTKGIEYLDEAEQKYWLEKQKEHQNKSDAREKALGRDLTFPLDKDKNLDEIAQDYVDGVKEYNSEPTWDLMQTAVCYGYHLAGQKPAEWSEKHIASVFEKVGLAKIVREQENDALTNAVQSAMLELSKVENTGWSDEDEDMRYKATAVLNKLCASNEEFVWAHSTLAKVFDWLKSLPKRFSPQLKQEWSEEEKDKLNSIERLIVNANAHGNYLIGDKEAIDLQHFIRSIVKPTTNLAEWSEEDKENFKWFDKFFRAESVVAGGRDIPQDKYLWFKSLRSQPKQNDMITPNKEFFQWIYDRLVNVHKEDPNVDYMISFKKRIEECSWKPSEDENNK